MVARLKELRLEKGISQQILADSIGVSQQSINKYENHAVEPSIETLVLFADFFEVSVDYLIGRSEQRRQSEPVQQYDLNYEESQIIDQYRALDKKDKRLIAAIMERLHE